MENSQFERNKKRESLKNMYFNRYLLIRYLLAVLLFSNFYWIIFSWGYVICIIPALLLSGSILSAYEMFKMIGNTKPSIQYTKLFFNSQMYVCLAGIFILLFAPVNIVFPFLTNTLLSRFISICLFGLGFFIAYIVNKKIKKIESNTDKQYIKIKQYEKTLRLHL